MAEFNVEGMEELCWAFLRQEEGATETVREMTQAAAEIYLEQLREAAVSYGLRKTGGFINSIKAGSLISNTTEMYILISPEGRADHGADYGGGGKANKRKGKSRKGNIRYAAMGGILEHGSSSMPARPWSSKGNEKAADPAYQKAQDIWGKYVDSCFR